jgi:hypothetical protein
MSLIDILKIQLSNLQEELDNITNAKICSLLYWINNKNNIIQKIELINNEIDELIQYNNKKKEIKKRDILYLSKNQIHKEKNINFF